jgi:glycoside/pentoside/hexuronide:cation symporter, GPH family
LIPVIAPAVPVFHSRSLRLSAKLLYGVGEMPITVLMVLFGLFALFFYNSVMGLPAPLVGVGFAAGLVIDALLDPYIGHVSDRSQGKLWGSLGRRHVFMLPGALAMGPCFFLLFSPPRHLGHGALFAWLMTWSIVLRATSAVYRIPYLSLGAELSEDYDDRTSTMAIRAIFGLIGTLAAAGLSFLLFFPATSDGSEPKLNYAGYPQMGLVFGALMTVSGLIGCLGTLGHRTYGSGKATEAALRFFSGFRIAMRNSAFRSLWFSVTLFFLAVVLNATLAIHYFTWYARINGGGRLSAIQTCFYVGALAGVCLWMALARRMEKRTLYILATVVTAFLLACAALFIGEGRLLGTGNALPLLVGHFVGGVFASVVWVIPASMIADVTDTDELSTGLRREGIFYGIMNFGEKIAAGGALLLAGVLLSLAGKLPHGALPGAQAPAAAPYLGWLYGMVPAVLILFSLVLVIPYRLDRRTVNHLQQQLSAQRESAPYD